MAKAAPKEDEATAHVRVTGPLTFTEYTTPDGLVVTEDGVDVPESEVDELVLTAARNGIALTVDYPSLEG